MEYAKLLLMYPKALAWPAVALTLELLYRKQVVGVFGVPGDVLLE